MIWLGKLHLQRVAFDFEGRAAHPDFHIQSLLQNFDMLIVLAQEIAEQAWIVKLQVCVFVLVAHCVSDLFFSSFTPYLL